MQSITSSSGEKITPSSGAKRRRKPRVRTRREDKTAEAKKTRTVATKKALANLQGMGGVKRIAVTGNRKVEHHMWKMDRKSEKKRVSARWYYAHWGEAAIGDRVDIRGEGKEEKCLKLNSKGIPRWSRCT